MTARRLLGRADIERLLRGVGARLLEQQLTGEILILGGAYMTLVLQQREATLAVDAYFIAHPDAIREAAAQVARQEALPPDWLNDAVKGFIYAAPTASVCLELPGRRVYAPDPAYVFAMKAFSGRPQDMHDLQVLWAIIGLATAAEALELVGRYVPERLLTRRVRFLIEDLFGDADG